MTCMCLMTQSCKNEDEDVDYNNLPFDALTMDRLLRHSDYSGYWIVDGVKADSCVMKYDGRSIIFSKMPVVTLFDKLQNYYTTYQGDSYPVIDNHTNAHFSQSPFVVNPIQTGYSENNIYFKNLSGIAESQEYNGSNKEYHFAYPDIGYQFTVENDGKTWQYLLIFDEDNYGVINAQQSSRVIILFLKGCYMISPEGKEESMTFDKMVELVFISND